jgi:ABC-type amino acid transport substrate-binding protein
MIRSISTIFGTLFLFIIIALAVNNHLQKQQVPRSIKSSILTVGTNAEFPPFEFIENGQLTGFDIDLMKEIARRLGKEIEIKDMPFTSLITQLQLGTLDVLAAALTPTPEREEHAFFTQPYLEGNPIIIVSRKSAPYTSLSQLEAKEVLINDGFTSERYVTAIPHVQVKRLPSVADALLALENNRADAFITAQSSMKEYISQQPDNPFHLESIPDTSEPSALAINKSKVELFEEINNILTILLSDGTITELKRKWGL